ncbi:Uncharacterised protein [Actinobacillus pleuropneumoniae]|nr:Uncharacterised protein [Actinobacillus pleuropneumoniae]
MACYFAYLAYRRFGFILFMEAATPNFIETFDLRPNRLFIEYLVHPKEVFSMLINGHLSSVIISTLLAVVSLVVYWKLSGWATNNLRFPNWKFRPLIGLLVAALVFCRRDVLRLLTEV